MKHAEFLIWRRREDKANAKLFVSKSSGAVTKTTGFTSTVCDFPAETRMDLGESLRVCVLATIW